AVDAAATKAGHLPGRIQTRHRIPRGVQHPAGQVRLESAQGFPGEDVKAYRDEEAVFRIEQLVRLGHPRQPIPDIIPRDADGGDLQILGEGIVDLPVPRPDLPFDFLRIQQILPRQPVHAFHQFRQGAGDDKILPVIQKRLNRIRRAGQHPLPDYLLEVLLRQIRILLGAGQSKFLLNDFLGQDEPGIIIARLQDGLQGSQRVKARQVRNGKPFSRRIQPDGGGAWQNANAVMGPDRVPVFDALRVMPHAVPVDDAPPARSAMANIRPSTWAGTPESMFLGGCPSQDGQCLRTRSKLPPMPPLETRTAWAWNSNSPTTSRELASPRLASLGTRMDPFTPVTAPLLVTNSSTR